MATRQERRRHTEALLVKAVGTLIQRDGVEALGVRAVAREAGVDKVLIYRYFGDLAGLLRFFGQSSDFWPSVAEVADGPLEYYKDHQSPSKLAREVLQNYFEALKRRPLTQKVLAFEPAGRNALTVELESVRQEWTDSLLARLQEENVPYSQSALMMTSVISAALNYLIARRELVMFGSLDLRNRQDINALFDVLEQSMQAFEE